MAAKLIMHWDVRPETEAEYFEFLVHEFIPSLNKLGIAEIQVWYTAYGECEQKQAEGIMQSADGMKQVLQSDDWLELAEKLESFVANFSQKVVSATGGFQI